MSWRRYSKRDDRMAERLRNGNVDHDIMQFVEYVSVPLYPNPDGLHRGPRVLITNAKETSTHITRTIAWVTAYEAT